MTQDPTLELEKLGPGSKPQLLCERSASRAEHRQSVGMPPRAVEGGHELGEQSFAERIRVYQPLDLGDEVTAGSGGELCIDSVLERMEAPLLEMGYFRDPRKRSKARSASGEPRQSESASSIFSMTAFGSDVARASASRSSKRSRSRSPGVDLEHIASGATFEPLGTKNAPQA